LYVFDKHHFICSRVQKNVVGDGVMLALMRQEKGANTGRWFDFAG